MVGIKKIKSPIGNLTLLASESGIYKVFWHDEKVVPINVCKNGGTPKIGKVLDLAEKQLEEYLGGRRHEFSIPLCLEGTQFQKEVWKHLKSIPWGATLTYGALAKILGDSKKARVVGLALGKNPVPIFLPCHRVIGAKGSLGGFSGGIQLKRYLLTLEGIKI